MEVSIIGGGNVAQHLAKKFLNCKIQLNNIYCRSRQVFELYDDIITSKPLEAIATLSNPREVLIIAVHDSAIQEVLQYIPDNIKIAYTSGAVALNNMPVRSNIGVFYPLQTLSIDSLSSDVIIPILLEANNEDFLAELRQIASVISDQVVFANSDYRKKVHLSAVFANNFTHHLLFLSQKIAELHNIDFHLLLPLIEETFNKIKKGSMYETQTGPAKRGDLSVIQSHLKLLSESEKKVYQTITESILNTYKKQENEL